MQSLYNHVLNQTNHFLIIDINFSNVVNVHICRNLHYPKRPKIFDKVIKKNELENKKRKRRDNKIENNSRQ